MLLKVALATHPNPEKGSKDDIHFGGKREMPFGTYHITHRGFIAHWEMDGVGSYLGWFLVLPLDRLEPHDGEVHKQPLGLGPTQHPLGSVKPAALQEQAVDVARAMGNCELIRKHQTHTYRERDPSV